jgi:uncharacterized protein (DUF427 family)
MTITIEYKGAQIARGEVGNNVVALEGNYYFDRSVVDFTMIKMKGEGQQYTCPIKKGMCDYYNLVDSNGGAIIDEIGWIYEHVNNSQFSIIEGKIAFYNSKGLDIFKSS